ncbi:MAG: hypothetical protein MUD07_11965, partial [Burkholderiaceae bacterium]|nr:hypothetical protein [Burkholderiaceae bacterium]
MACASFEQSHEFIEFGRARGHPDDVLVHRVHEIGVAVRTGQLRKTRRRRRQRGQLFGAGAAVQQAQVAAHQGCILQGRGAKHRAHELGRHAGVAVDVVGDGGVGKAQPLDAAQAVVAVAAGGHVVHLAHVAGQADSVVGPHPGEDGRVDAAQTADGVVTAQSGKGIGVVVTREHVVAAGGLGCHRHRQR